MRTKILRVASNADVWLGALQGPEVVQEVVGELVRDCLVACKVRKGRELDGVRDEAI